jgi:hypothetical protein
MVAERLSYRQFSVAQLFEWVSWCCVIAAFSGAIGPAAAGFLMAMALALCIRHGLLALAMFAAGMLAAEAGSMANHGPQPASNRYAAVAVMFLAGALAAWHWLRWELEMSRRRAKPRQAE